MEGFVFGGDEVPDEVREWLDNMMKMGEKIGNQDMAANLLDRSRELWLKVTGANGMGSGNEFTDTINLYVEDDEEDMTPELVEEQHREAEALMKHVTANLTKETPSEDWSGLTDGDKVRLVVLDHFVRMHDMSTCIHRQRVERALLDIADRLDLMDLLEHVDTRVSCDMSWMGNRNSEHWPLEHTCQRTDGHAGRHQCVICGSTTTRTGRPDG